MQVSKFLLFSTVSQVNSQKIWEKRPTKQRFHSLGGWSQGDNTKTKQTHYHAHLESIPISTQTQTNDYPRKYVQKHRGGRVWGSKRRSPYVLCDHFISSVREVKVDEIWKQRHVEKRRKHKAALRSESRSLCDWTSSELWTEQELVPFIMLRVCWTYKRIIIIYLGFGKIDKDFSLFFER